MVHDQLKLASDDAFFNEDHISFMLKKYRTLLIKREYERRKGEITDASYQTICLDLEEVPAIPDEPCEGGSYMRSVEKIPKLIDGIIPRLYFTDYFQGEITYVSRQRLRYTGNNRWLKNIVYAAIGPDDYLYLKSSNPQLFYVEQMRFSGIFDDPEKASELDCDRPEEGEGCDPWDREFPIEEWMQAMLIESVVRELLGYRYQFYDKRNDANDNDATDIGYGNARRNTADRGDDAGNNAGDTGQ